MHCAEQFCYSHTLQKYSTEKEIYRKATLSIIV